jgi:hypothetical protein
MHYRSLLIVTYGRSGSTLLQGILNSIDGVLVRGENMDFCWGLYSAWKSLVDATKQPWAGRSNQPRNAWFGADRLSPERFLIRARQILVEQLAPQPGVRCIGFKEIRYLDHLSELSPYLNFLSLLLPGTGFVFNTRDHKDVVDSGFWKGQDRVALRKRLRLADELFYAFAEDHPNAFVMRYEALIKGASSIRPLFEFLGASPSVERLQLALETPHSYSPRPTTLNRALQARETGRPPVGARSVAPALPEGLSLDSVLTAGSVDAQGVLVITPIRDQHRLIPWFLDYYRRLGCAGFLFVDHGSTDDSVDLLRQQDDVILYRASPEASPPTGPHRQWIKPLVQRHAWRRWVLCVDVDELLCWPGHDQEGVGALVRRAERLGLNRVLTPIIDAYGDWPTEQMPAYEPGTAFGETCPWVDPIADTKFIWDNDRLLLFGGPLNRSVRPGESPPLTTKQALYYVDQDDDSGGGAHIGQDRVPSPLVAPLLRYRFMPDARERRAASMEQARRWNHGQDERRDQIERLSAQRLKTDRSIRVTSGHDLQGHIIGLSRLIRQRGLAGSRHLTGRLETD